MASTGDPSSTEVLLAEYAAAQATYLHYDAFRWQAGSFLITGVFIFWGLLVQQSIDPRVGTIASLLVAGLMSTWLLFAHHYRQIYKAKLHRIQEIERELGMEQHRRFLAGDRLDLRYRIHGPHGHDLDVVVYLLAVGGTPFLAFAQDGFSVWYLVIVPFAATVIATVIRNERKSVIEDRAGTRMPAAAPLVPDSASRGPGAS